MNEPSEDTLSESLRRVETLMARATTVPQADSSRGPESQGPEVARRDSRWGRLARILGGWGLVRETPDRTEDRGLANETPATRTSRVDELRNKALDQAAPSGERRSALVELFEREQGAQFYPEVVLALIDDPDIELACDAIALSPPFDAKGIARLRQLLDDPRLRIWQAAASALARKKDHATLPRMLEWARRGDAPHRRAGLAAVAFLLIPEEHLAVVESICEDGPRDDEDEAVLVEALRVAESRVAFWRKATGQHDDGSS